MIVDLEPLVEEVVEEMVIEIGEKEDLVEKTSPSTPEHSIKCKDLSSNVDKAVD